MSIRRPLDLILVLGALTWPITLFAFGTDDDTGRVLAGIGGVLVLGSLAAELVLRFRERRRSDAC